MKNFFHSSFLSYGLGNGIHAITVEYCGLSITCHPHLLYSVAPNPYILFVHLHWNWYPASEQHQYVCSLSSGILLLHGIQCGTASAFPSASPRSYAFSICACSISCIRCISSSVSCTASMDGTSSSQVFTRSLASSKVDPASHTKPTLLFAV